MDTNSYSFSINQLKLFQEHGYIVIQNAVPSSIIERAKHAIHAHIGKYGIPPDTYQTGNLVPDLLEKEDHELHRRPIIDLWRSLSHWIYNNFEDMAEINGIPQVAFRFPSYSTYTISGGHLDGLSTPLNGIMDPERLHSFTALVGVALTTQLREFDGNLVVYPGSHKRVNQFLNYQHTKFGRIGRGDSLEWPITEYVPPGAIDGISPTQLFLNAGDAIVCHYQLVHTVSPNLNDNIRINLYWRLTHKNHDVLSLWQGIDHKIIHCDKSHAPTETELHNIFVLVEMFGITRERAARYLFASGGRLEQAIELLLTSPDFR